MGLISSLLLVPSCGALLLAIFPFNVKVSRLIGSICTLVVLALSLVGLWHFDPLSADFQFVERVPWIPEFGVNYEVGIDGISLFLVILTAIAGVSVLFMTKDHERLRGFTSLFLFLQIALLGVFVTLDLVLFYVFFELMLVPTYLLMNGWGGVDRSRAAIRFVLFTAIGSVLMLSSIIYLGWLKADQGGEPSFSIIDLSQSLSIDSGTQYLLFLGFLIAFAIKTPFVPFHNWLPAAYGEAPYGLTAFLSAVMAKAGLYGLLRFAWPLFPGSFYAIAPTLMSVLAAGVLYTALIAWAQRDAKRLLAYSSVSHLGVCGLGVVICSTLSVTAAVFFMVVHGLVALGLFLSLSALSNRGTGSEISELGGLATKLPKLSFIFFIFLLGSIALPLTGNFVAEFTVLLAAFAKYPLQTAIAGLSVIFGAVYMLALFRRAMFGKNERAPKGEDLTNSEFLILGPLAALVIVLGVLPQPLLRRIEPSARRLEAFVFKALITPPVQQDFGEMEEFSTPTNESKDLPEGTLSLMQKTSGLQQPQNSNLALSCMPTKFSFKELI